MRRELLNAMQRVTIGDLKPDLTVILDVPGGNRHASAPPPGAARRPPTGSRRKTSAFISDLRDAYRQIAANEPERCVLIDATAEPAKVAANIWSALRDRFFATSTGNAAISA